MQASLLVHAGLRGRGLLLGPVRVDPCSLTASLMSLAVQTTKNVFAARARPPGRGKPGDTGIRLWEQLLLEGSLGYVWNCSAGAGLKAFSRKYVKTACVLKATALQ